MNAIAVGAPTVTTSESVKPDGRVAAGSGGTHAPIKTTASARTATIRGRDTLEAIVIRPPARRATAPVEC